MNATPTQARADGMQPHKRYWLYRLGVWWLRLFAVVVAVILWTGGMLWYLFPIHLLVGLIVLSALRYVAYSHWRMSMFEVDRAVFRDAFKPSLLVVRTSAVRAPSGALGPPAELTPASAARALVCATQGEKMEKS